MKSENEEMKEVLWDGPAVLARRYQAIHSRKKDSLGWAVRKAAPPHEPVRCSVPFIGKKYAGQPLRLLLYGSAENLTGYDGYLDDDRIAADRHRYYFEKNAGSGDFFPGVHMAPLDDGSLLTAAFYAYLRILEKRGEDIGKEERPAEFCERICFGNYCKYTLSGERNRDYAGNRELLSVSREYIKADMEVLRPGLVILPKKIYETERDFIDSVKGEAEILPLIQINAGTINRLIAKRYPPPVWWETDEIGKRAMAWYGHLGENGISGKTKENYRAVFAYLDEVLEGW